MIPVFTKSTLQFDVNLLNQDVEYILTKTEWHPEHNQISLQYSNKDINNQWYSGTGKSWEEVDGKWKILIEDDEVININQALKGTYIEHVLHSLPFTPVRTRLMRMNPKSCYSIHRDTSARWHIALKTSEHARFVFTADQVVHHIPANGHPYFIDTTREHTAFNGNTDYRIHLVMLDLSVTVNKEYLKQWM